MIIKLAFAFGAGFISFLTPCVLPIIPGYISYITGIIGNTHGVKKLINPAPKAKANFMII